MDDRPASQTPRFGVVVPSSGALAEPESFAERAGLFSFSLDLGKAGGDAAYVRSET